jgi:hypothetical protein
VSDEPEPAGEDVRTTRLLGRPTSVDVRMYLGVHPSAGDLGREAMALSSKARQKHSVAAAGLLPTGSTLRSYVVGRGNARLTNQAIIVSSVFAAVFVLLLVVAHTIIFPGFLVLVYVIQVTRPPRGIALTDQGMALLSRSPWSGKPNGVLALVGPMPLTARQVMFGSESVTLSPAEMRLLTSAANTYWAPPAAPPPGSFGTAPPPAGFGVPPTPPSASPPFG